MASWSLSCLISESSTSVNICRKIRVPDFFLSIWPPSIHAELRRAPQHPHISAPVPRHKCDLLHNTSFPCVRIMQRWPTNSPWDWYTHTCGQRTIPYAAAKRWARSLLLPPPRPKAQCQVEEGVSSAHNFGQRSEEEWYPRRINYIFYQQMRKANVDSRLSSLRSEEIIVGICWDFELGEGLTTTEVW